jgi:hypothetical protein
MVVGLALLVAGYLADLEGYSNMADSDYLKYLQSPGGSTDPYAVNPFAEGAPADESGLTPFAGADVPPFRFTQNALNPTTQATGGFAGRTQVARSPFTSGQEYQSLRGIRSELEKMGDVQAPGDAPIMPQELAAPPPTVAPITAPPQVTNETQGLPTMSVYLPESTVLSGMNPLFAARMFMAKNEGKDQKTLEKEYGPVREMQAYDMKSMLGDEEYNMWFGKDASYQGGENQAAQRFMTNLSILPTSIDPFSNVNTQKQLASRDFAYAPSGRISNDDLRKAITMGTPLPTVEEGGKGIIGYTNEGEGERSPIYGDTNVAGSYDLSFDANNPDRLGTWNEDAFRASLEKDLNNPIHNSTKTIRFAKQATRAGALTLIGAAAGNALGAVAGAMAGTAGAAAGGASGAATGGATAASGIAGGLGMTAGPVASAVNTVAGMVGSYGAAKAAEMIGLPMDNPLMIMAMAAAGGALSYSPTTPVTDPGALTTQHLSTAGSLGMTPEAYASQILQSPSIEAYVQTQVQAGQNLGQQGLLSNTGNPGTSLVDPATFSKGAAGIGSAMENLTQSQKDALMKYGFKTGLGYASNQLTPGPGGGGEAIGYDAQMSEYNRLMEQYQSEMGQYNTDLGAYNQAVSEWQRKQELSQMYEQKMAEYEAKVGLYSNVQGLRGKQANMMSQIQGNLAENPFYDTPENYTGIQTMFV